MSVLYSLATRYGRRKPLLAGVYFDITWIDRFYFKLKTLFTKWQSSIKIRAWNILFLALNLKFNSIYKSEPSAFKTRIDFLISPLSLTFNDIRLTVSFLRFGHSGFDLSFLRLHFNRIPIRVSSGRKISGLP